MNTNNKACIYFSKADDIDYIFFVQCCYCEVPQQADLNLS